MMKKIKNIRELQEAKTEILKRQNESESRIRSNWIDLKEAMMPRNIIKETLNETAMQKTEDVLTSDSLLKNTMMYGLTLLAKMVTDKVGDKVGNWIKKKS